MEPQEARLSDVIRAGHVATPIAQAEFINQGEDGAAAYSRLSSMRIDQAPVKHNNHIVGWAQTSWLEPQTRVKRPQHALGDSTLVAASAPFSQLLQVLGRSGLVFTVENGITGFVTPSDLERHAARTYFYLLISGIEMQLAALLQQIVSTDEVISSMAEGSLSRWEADSRAGREAAAIEYLDLHELVSLFKFSFAREPNFKRHLDWLTRINQFRPRVMHSNRSLSGGRDASELAALARQAEEVSTALSQLIPSPGST